MRKTDLGMSIAALSVDMAMAETQERLGVSVLKEAMDVSGENVLSLLEDTAAVLDPSLGATVDIMA